VLGARGIAPGFLAENLRQIGQTFLPGLDASAAEAVRRTVEAGAAAALESPLADEPAAPDALALSRAVFTQAALAGDRVAAGTVAREAIREGHRVVDVYVGLLQKSQYEVGRLWEANRITVAEEHIATAVTQFVVSQLYPLLQRSSTCRGPAVITGIEGELHQLGGHMVADVLESDGWDVRFLGTNLPADGVLRVVAEHQPAMVGISATMLFNLDKVVALMERLRAAAGHPPKVVVGGGAFRSAPGLWREIGADGFAADLGDVAAMVRSVAGESGVS
jgi:methanogenic corrinoid protein MtbC1